MKKWLGFWIIGLTFLGFLMCFSAQAQTWKELFDQADSLYNVADYDSAIVVGKFALEKAEKEFGRDDTIVASVLHLLGKCYFEQGKYAQAESLFNRSLPIKKKTLGPVHPEVGQALTRLGWIYYFNNKNAEAESLLERVLAIYEKVSVSDNVEVALSLNALACVYQRQVRYAEAEPLYKRALAIREKAFGPDHLKVANILINMGNFYEEWGKYEEAESLCKRALVIYEKALGSDHCRVAGVLNVLAVCKYDQCKYTESERLYKRALAIEEKTHGSDHPHVAVILINMGNEYQIQSRYAEAEPLYKRSLAIVEKALGPDHQDVAYILHGLGGLYYKIGKYEEAVPLYKRTLAIWENTLGSNHPHVATVLNNIAIIYGEQGKYNESESLYKRALVIREKAFGSDHPSVAKILNDLAILFSYQGKYVESESLFQQAIIILNKTGDSETGSSFHHLANLYRDQGRYAEAESLYQLSIISTENTLGSRHFSFADISSDRALLFKDKREFAKAKEDAKSAYNQKRRSFRDNHEVLSEQEALTRSKFMRDEASQYISILFDSQDTTSSCRKEITEVVFSSKGQISDGIFARYRTHVYDRDPNLKVLSDSLRYSRTKLANLYIQGPDEGSTSGYMEELQKVSAEKERFEAELARQSADFRKELELWEVDAEKVASVLPHKSILIEYLKYDRLKSGTIKRETEPHYLSVVVDSKNEVFVSDLGKADEIDSIVTLYRAHFREISTRGGSPFARDLENYKGIAGKLYDQIWKPIEKHLGDDSLVFIAPDGELNLVSFAGLIDEGDKYLIESYPIQYLSSGRDLIRLKDVVKPGKGLFALGDPDFDASASARLSSTPAVAQTPHSNTSVYRFRNVRSGSEELSKIKVLPLPGTRQEIEKISKQWEEKTKETGWVYLGTDASEENFKRNASGKRVIHLATHGYYAQNQSGREMPQEKIGMMEAFVGENPLLLSGLFLAGANLHGEVADSLGVEDGILTAEEVTGMELAGTEWVVLSACESGLGQVKSGEGVYGLRRAFQMAGARTVISALWPVSDKTTAEMMSYLYGYKEDNLALAMQNLAKNNLAELRKKHQPDHPYLWAPFIALGDWK